MENFLKKPAAHADKSMEPSDTIESAKALIKATENIPTD